MISSSNHRCIQFLWSGPQATKYYFKTPPVTELILSKSLFLLISSNHIIQGKHGTLLYAAVLDYLLFVPYFLFMKYK